VSRRARGWASRLVLALSASVVAVAAAELVLRRFGHAPDPGLFTVTERQFARIPGIFAPNQRVTEAKGTRFEHTTRINSLGYRGAELTRERPSGHGRVLLVGDSFTWGHNVPDDSTTPAALQRQLSAACGPTQVINAGLSGSTIAGQDEMVLRGLALAPDLVLLTYHENDIDELMYSRIWEQLAENRRLKSRFPVSVAYPLLRRTAIWNLLQQIRRARAPYVPQSAGAGLAALDTAIGPSAGVLEAREEYRTRLTAIRDSLAARGIPLVYSLFPHPSSVRAGAGARDYAWAAENARALGIPTLDLLDTLRLAGTGVEELYLLPEDYHPSAAGHTLAAAFLAPRLTALLPRWRCAT
jgi:lysophospholipase L1-like esterase